MKPVIRRALCAVALAAVALGLWVPPAAAHTDFESSTPANGAVVDAPVGDITIGFTGAADAAGDGFVVLDSSGIVRTPDAVATPDDRTFVLSFDEPLAGGTIGVRWNVAAPDTHPIGGSFSFDVTAPLPTTTTTTISTTTTPNDSASPAPTSAEEVDHSGHADHTDDSGTTDLDEFLATDAHVANGARALGSVGRVATYAAAILAIGALVFAWRVASDDDGARSRAISMARAAGPLLVVGAIIESVAHVATFHGHWSALSSLSDINDAIASNFGVAVAMRILAGVLLVFGLTKPQSNGTHATENPSNLGATAAFAGATVAISFSFMGHTVSEGPRWLHAVANAVHVTAAGVWIGGLAVLATIAWHRSSGGSERRIAPLAVRFSVAATFALAAVGAAGVALSIIIVDTPSQLWSSDWGRLLILKVGLVAIAVAGGAYNHRVLVPALDAEAESGPLDAKFRRVIGGELLAGVGVIVVTAILVASSL